MGQFLFSRKKNILILEVGSMPGCINAALLSAGPKLTAAIALGEPAFLDSSPESDGLVSEGRLKITNSNALEFLKTIGEGSVDVSACFFAVHSSSLECMGEEFKQLHRALKKGGLLISAFKHRTDIGVEVHTDWQIRKQRPENDNRTEIALFGKDASELMKGLGFNSVRKIYSAGTEKAILAKK